MRKHALHITGTACLAAFLGLTTSGILEATEEPREGKVRVAILCDDSGDGNRKPRLADLEDSAKHLRIRLNDTKWIVATDPDEEPENADMIFTILDRRKIDERGLVLKYELRSGAYRQVDEFDYAGGAVASGGVRSLGFTGDNGGVKDTVTALGWPHLAARLAAQLDEFSELNYELIIKQRDK